MKSTNYLVVFCHPSKNSFTNQVKDKVLECITNAGHKYELSDLYAMNFNPVISEEEYLREAFYNEEKEIPQDVKAEQAKLERADVAIFIFPDFWTSSPAMLEGWFQRVLTYGFAYGNQGMKPLEQAIFFMTMGGSLKDEIRRKQVEGIRDTMIVDRMHERAKQCEFYVFDEMTRGYGNDENRAKRTDEFLKKIEKMLFS